MQTADVLLSNFKPGTLDEWGLGYEHLASIKPGLIWAAASYLGPKVLKQRGRERISPRRPPGG